MKIGLCIKYFQVFFKKPKKTYNMRMFESNWKYVTTMGRHDVLVEELGGDMSSN